MYTNIFKYNPLQSNVLLVKKPNFILKEKLILFFQCFHGNTVFDIIAIYLFNYR